MKKMNSEQFFDAIKLIAQQNLIEEVDVIEILRDVILKHFHSKFDPDAELELTINPEKKIFKLVNNSVLVIEDEYATDELSDIEISLTEAKKLKKDAKLDDMISKDIDLHKFQNPIRQLLTQNFREKKKANIYGKHAGLQGQTIKAQVEAISRGNVKFKLEDGVEAFMPAKVRNTRIKMAMGQWYDVYVEEVREESRDAQIIVSNGSPTVLRKIIEMEVPEVAEELVEIVNISRIPGYRSKIAVKSNSENIDAVGTIIGPGGSRINTIIEKIHGEKIDVIAWNENINTFIANALEPAKVISIIDKEEAITHAEQRDAKLIVTPNEHQTLAIGAHGSNAKLAADLVGFRLDIISVEEAENRELVLEWNGTITPEDLERIKDGSFVNRGKRPQRNNGGLGNSAKNFSEFDDEFEKYNEIISDDTQEIIIPDFGPIEYNDEPEQDNDSLQDVSDIKFSDNELDEMASQFDLGSSGLDLDDYDMGDNIEEE